MAAVLGKEGNGKVVIRDYGEEDDNGVVSIPLPRDNIGPNNTGDMKRVVLDSIIHQSEIDGLYKDIMSTPLEEFEDRVIGPYTADPRKKIILKAIGRHAKKVVNGNIYEVAKAAWIWAATGLLSDDEKRNIAPRLERESILIPGLKKVYREIAFAK